MKAWHDPLAGLQAYSNCLRFADLDADGDYHLLCGTLEKSLKIYRGMSVLSKHVLLGIPVSVVSLFTDGLSPTPSVAVASGPYVFIYRNLRPYFKFTIPQTDIHETEKQVWKEIKDGSVTTSQAYDKLSEARDGGITMSSRSLELLSVAEPEKQEAFVAKYKDQPLVQKTVITCMETVRKDSEDENSISRLVIGTENQTLLIVNPLDCSILVNCRLPGVPVFVAALGLMDVDYRILIASREGKIFLIKNGDVSSKVIEVEAPPVGLVCVSSKEVFVGVTGKVIHSFKIKGKKNYTLHLDSEIKCMELFSKGSMEKSRALLVALANGEVRLYKDRQLIDTITNTDVVMGMRCGRYGREDVSLVMVHVSGALTVNIFRRRAKLTSDDKVVVEEASVPLNIPKKTKLYVEQTQRERDQATEMHRIFQRDLCKLRLTSARSYVKIITDGNGPVSYSKQASVRLEANVVGLGPPFKIKMKIQNTGRKPLVNIPVTFGFQHDLYTMAKPYFKIPVLIPNLHYDYEVKVRSVHETGASGTIRIFLCNEGSQAPIISAIVQMPMSEVLLTGP